jgi:serine/threonine-protein phosphatase 2A activator
MTEPTADKGYPRILSESDMKKWIDSPSYNKLVQFIEDLQDLVTGLTNDALVHTSDNCQKLSEILDRVDKIVHENPVVKEKAISRFGKGEFRDFFDQVNRESQELLATIIPDQLHIDEVKRYFAESWGNRTRIDYGSGHELNFIMVLFCLREIEIFNQQDYPYLVIKIFNEYIAIMRKLQVNYWLEPAGSHGVWGLDDYHFLPFLFGASQLSTHDHMKPKSIHNQDLVQMYHKQYMYFECIHFINNIKTIPNQLEKLSLRWHSPMLDDISAAKSWDKIKQGMIKMYKAEVLGKLPIMQHFMFGKILECPQGITGDNDGPDDCDHGHIHQSTWGDCCGIKIPSAIAASESLRKQKPVPFD